MNFDIMAGTYYLVENETYESGKRVVLVKELGDDDYRGFPKVKVALFQGMFVILHDNEKADPLLICTQGYIEFVG